MNMIAMMILPMLSVLLMIGPLVYILYKQDKKKRLIEDGKKKHSIQKAILIRYDKRQFANSKKASITFLVLWIVSFALTFLEWVEWVPDFVSVIIRFLFLCSGPAFLYSVYEALAGHSYLKRLEKYGYEIPDNKKDYDYLLEMLPRKRQGTKNLSSDGNYNKCSLILAVSSLVVLCVLIGYNIWFLLDWRCMVQGERIVTFGMMSPVDIVLLINCIKFFRQVNEKYYKDDVEIDYTRKNRISFMEGILIIIVLSVGALIVKDTYSSMTEYIFKARVSSDIERVQNIERVFDMAYATLGEQDDTSEWETTYNALIAGVEITTWKKPQDIFQKEITKELGISDFSELKDDFRTVVGDAKVYVQLEDGNFVVEVLNPPDKVSELFDYTIRAE